MKDAFDLLGIMILQHPNLSSTFCVCLSSIESVFNRTLSKALKGGGYSFIVRFICKMGAVPDLFQLFEGPLKHSVPLMLNSLSKERVLNSMFEMTAKKKVKKATCGLVEGILNFILQLCRGGHENSLKGTKESASRVAMKSRRSRKRRRTSSSESENEENLNNMERQSGDEWQGEMKENCLRGRNILKPHLNALLVNLEIILSYRNPKIVEGAVDDVEGRAKKGLILRQQLNHSVRMKSLEILVELSQYMTRDAPTACRLIKLLLMSLPKREARNVADKLSYRKRMCLASIQELLVHCVGFREAKGENEEMRSLISSTLSLLSTSLTEQLGVGLEDFITIPAEIVATLIFLKFFSCPCL